MVRIPSEYQEVEYIESTGTEWIDTGIVPKVNTISQIKFLNVERTGNVIYGFYKGSESGDYRFFLTNSQFYWDIFTGRLMKPPAFSNTIYELELGNRYIKDIPSDTILASEQAISESEFTRNYSITLNSYSNTRFSKNKWYYVKIFEGDTPVRDLIPCYRKSDHEPGMYDLVSGTFFTNSGTGTFLVGNDVEYSTVSLLEARRKILLNTPHLTSASGQLATFNTDLAAPLKGMKVHFYPVQASGTPSPDNVLPISGWDRVTVYHNAGKNLTPTYSDTDFWNRKAYFNVNGKITDNGNYKMCDYKPALPNKTYIFSSSNSRWKGIGFYDAAYNPIAFKEASAISIQLYAPSNTKFYRVYGFWNLSNPQFELGSTATDYEPYNGISIPITFPQTIYGGYVDLVKGEVVETWKQMVVDENSTVGIFPWHGIQIDSATGTEFATALFRRPNSYPKGFNIASNLCDKLPYSTIHNKMNHAYFYDGDSYGPAISLPTSLIGTTNETLMQYLSENPFVFCYRVRTPNVYPLTPQTIKTLKGINNIFSDANGDVYVTYWKH